MVDLVKSNNDKIIVASDAHVATEIFLFDDLFTLQRERVMMVCQEIKQRRLPLKWSAQGRVGLADLEMLSAMKKMGCTELLFGVESGSNRILSFFKKGFTREEVSGTPKFRHLF